MHMSASHRRSTRLLAWVSALLLTLSYVFSALYQPTAVYAADVTNRRITMGSSREDAETTYAIQFTVPAGTTLGAVRVEFCDGDPIVHTTCVFGAAGDDIPEVDGTGAGTIATESVGSPFAFSGATTCTDPALTAPTNNDRYLEILCNAADTFAGATTFTGTVINVDNPSNATDSPNNPNNTFYARVYIYSDITPPAIANPITATEVVHTGGIAMSTAEQLTITARVQEILEFCVGTTTPAPADCSAMTGNAVNLGVLDFASVDRATTQAVPNQGSVMVRTNAQSGVAIGYIAEQATSGTEHLGSLRVTGAACTAGGGIESDQCINSIGTAQTVVAAGVEAFGMCSFDVDVTSSTGSPTANLTRDGEYNGSCDNSAGNGYAWDESGAYDQIASSATVVNDEMLDLDFSATSDVITPTGLYTVTATFIGTATF